MNETEPDGREGKQQKQWYYNTKHSANVSVVSAQILCTFVNNNNTCKIKVSKNFLYLMIKYIPSFQPFNTYRRSGKYVQEVCAHIMASVSFFKIN